MKPTDLGQVSASRDREEVRARVHWAATVRGGSSDAVLLTGEAGIGKSTLWAEGVKLARSSGIRVLAAAAVEAESSMPYVVLGDLLADVIDEVLPDLPHPQREALEIALLMASPSSRPPSVRLIAMAVQSVLTWCAERSSVLVAVDDLRWADAASQEALAFALRRLSDLPVRLLMSMRTGGPFDTGTETPEMPLALLDIFSLRQHFPLPPLTPSEVRTLVKDRIGLSVTRGDSELICAATLGNPFWVLELAGTWLRDQRQHGDPMPIPDTLQAMTVGRVSALGSEVVDALCVVSALGSPTIHVAAKALTGMVTDPIRALDLAVCDGVLNEVDGRLVAAHPLLSAAAMKAIPPGRQLELHRRLVEVAESPEAKAHHMALTVDESDPGPVGREVAAAFDEAVEHARNRGAAAHAVVLAEQALRFTRPEDNDLDRRRIVAARLQRDVANFDRAAELLAMVDLAALETPLLEVALPIRAGLVYLLSGPDAASAVLTGAARPGERDPRRLAVLHTQSAGRFYGDFARREEHAYQAVRYSEQVDPEGSCTHQAYLQLIDVKVDSGEGLDTELLARARQLESVPGKSGGPTSLDVHWAQGLVITDELAGASEILMAALTYARTVADDLAISLLSMLLGEAQLLAGDAESAMMALAESDEAMDWAFCEPTHRAQLKARLFLATGRVDDVVELVDRLGWATTPHRTRRMAADHVLGLVAAARGDHEVAVELLTRARDAAEEFGNKDTGARYRMDTELGEQLVHAGRPGEAAAVAERLLAAGKRGGRCTLRGVGQRILGLCAAAAGDLDRAAELLSAAVDEHEFSQLRPELGRSLLALARVNLKRRSRRSTREDIERAASIFAGGGLIALRDEARAELERISAAGSAEVLTTAELRVVEAVAAGASNREAAQSLHVGTRTVESHLAAAYRKLGVRSRRELALLFEQGVTHS
jgi:DNA-binding CsgD family transcriptional regulator